MILSPACIFVSVIALLFVRRSACASLSDEYAHLAQEHNDGTTSAQAERAQASSAPLIADATIDNAPLGITRASDGPMAQLLLSRRGPILIRRGSILNMREQDEMVIGRWQRLGRLSETDANEFLARVTERRRQIEAERDQRASYRAILRGGEEGPRGGTGPQIPPLPDEGTNSGAHSAQPPNAPRTYRHVPVAVAEPVAEPRQRHPVVVAEPPEEPRHSSIFSCCWNDDAVESESAGPASHLRHIQQLPHTPGLFANWRGV